MSDTIDFSFLQDISDGDIPFEKELIELYLEDVAGHLLSLKAMLGEEALEPVRALAHNIKGSSANLGAVLMRSRAEELERRAINAGECWKTEFQSLQAAFTTTKTRFEIYLRSLES